MRYYGPSPLHVRDLEEIVDDLVLELVEENFPSDWDENYLSRELAKKLRTRLDSLMVADGKVSRYIDCSAYKLEKPLESDRGDIAILVRYQLSSKRLIEGVGFLEAKRRDRSKNTFTPFSVGQLDRLLKRSPRTVLLLYDYDPAPVLDTIEECDALHWNRRRQFSHALVVPINLTKMIRQGKAADSSLYPFCYSLTNQIVRRYLSLLDLEFGNEIVDTVKGVFKGKGERFDLPSYLLIVDVGTSRDAMPEKLVLNQETHQFID